MHHKFCLIDTKRWINVGTVINGSLNWTYGVGFLFYLNLMDGHFYNFSCLFFGFRVSIRIVKMSRLLNAERFKMNSMIRSMIYGAKWHHQSKGQPKSTNEVQMQLACIKWKFSNDNTNSAFHSSRLTGINAKAEPIFFLLNLKTRLFFIQVHFFRIIRDNKFINLDSTIVR